MDIININLTVKNFINCVKNKNKLLDCQKRLLLTQTLLFDLDDVKTMSITEIDNDLDYLANKYYNNFLN